MNIEQVINRRFGILFAAVILMVGSLFFGMFEKQVIDHNKYIALAEGQQRFEETELAQRGKIYARDSYFNQNEIYPLAFDIKNYSLFAIPKQIVKKDETAKSLAELSGISETEIFDKINNDKLYLPALKKGIDYDTALRIRDKKITGVYIVPEYARFYPESSLASQVLGFVNAEGKGNYGFEGHYNFELQGTPGKVTGEKDTLGRIISYLDQKGAKDGTGYVLTIARPVQFFVEQKLAEAVQKYQADSGTVVIMDVKTGGIVAMASTPTFDPNKYQEHANQDQNIFINPAIAHIYEPGSVFKPFTMAAALDTGTVTPETENVFSNYTVVDGHEIHTALDVAYGKENMSQILQHSDNVGMVWVGQQLGSEKFYDYINKFNFLDKTNIDLDSEAPGSVPALKDWHNIGLATISFGQGISITPIELVSGYNALANGGVYVYPRVADKIIMPGGEEKNIEKRTGSRVIKEETATQIKGMLVSVVESGFGKKAGVPGYKVAGKTGTAQIPKSGGGYEENIFNHSFAGFAPADDPCFAMLVKLDKPKSSVYAESTAAPLFGEIASFLLNNYYRIPASN